MAALAASERLLLPESRAASCKAIAFDAFTILDPRPIAAMAEQFFPGRGAVLMDLWRARQFEYTWLRTLTRTYADFSQVTEEALIYAAKALSLDLGGNRRQRLLEGFWEFRAWPDAAAALRQLKMSGIRLALLSNLTERMLRAAGRSSGLADVFEAYLSTDSVRAFKPHPSAYEMGEHELGLDRREIVFAAFAGWDVAGAKAFGYRTFWVNRMNLPQEELGFSPDATGKDLNDLGRFVVGDA